MNGNLERRVERLERAVGLSEGDNPRAYTYPNDLSELMVMARMTDQQLQQHLRNRRNRPFPEMCDSFDELFEKAKATKGNQTVESRAVE